MGIEKAWSMSVSLQRNGVEKSTDGTLGHEES